MTECPSTLIFPKKMDNTTSMIKCEFHWWNWIISTGSWCGVFISSVFGRSGQGQQTCVGNTPVHRTLAGGRRETLTHVAWPLLILDLRWLPISFLRYWQQKRTAKCCYCMSERARYCGDRHCFNSGLAECNYDVW